MVATGLVAVLLALGSASTAPAAPGARTGARDETRAGAVPEGPGIAVVMTAGAGRTEAWDAGQAAYDELCGLLDPAYIGTERAPREWAEVRYPPGPASRAPGGDVAMLRQHQLSVADGGTPWVRTVPAPDVADDDIRRHRAPRREYDRPAGGGFPGLGGAPAAAREGGAVEGVWWAAGGLAVGVLGTLLIRSATAGRGAGPPWDEPRQELIDL
ncbi:hypothetical protein [Streptomyces olivaceoviridis]|uniref:hypothetical protein n=1 Tax=Streptomyces olivaceoviridis TaxID=1921 RepID=UPI0036F8A33D